MPNVPSLSDVIDYLHVTIQGIKRVNFDEVDLDTLNNIERTINEALRHLTNIKHHVDDRRVETLFALVNDIKEKLERAKDSFPLSVEQRRIARLPNLSKKGNSFCDIDRATLEQLLNLGFSVKQIAKRGLLGGIVHPNTVYNFMKKNGIPARNYTNISDEDLESVIKGLSDEFPNSGIKEMRALLFTREPSIRVPIQRIQRILRAVNPVGSTRRWVQVVKRRSYHVKSPNSLWHVDTNHKLIRWNFVIDASIDGYSRLVPYLKVHVDNLARTAFNDFTEGIREYGVPSRMRADKGGEFTHIKTFVEKENGEDRGSFIKGRSVHNQRIERLWRDVYVKVLDKYRRTFYYLENKELLDVDNEIHVSVLQWVFLNRIQRDLDIWRNAHNHHFVRTEGKTPMQLWYMGIVENVDRPSTSIQNALRMDLQQLDERIDRFVAENDLSEPSDISIVLPRYPLPLTDAEINELALEIDVLAPSENFGIDIYAKALRYVYTCIRI